MRGSIVAAALTFVGAIGLSGCAGDPAGTAPPKTESCQEIAEEVRDISNGIQSTLAAPASVEELEDYLGEASTRVEDAIQGAGDDTGLIDALGGFQTAVNEVSVYAGGLTETPSEEDPSAVTVEQDPDQLAEQQGVIADAAAEVSAACVDE